MKNFPLTSVEYSSENIAEDMNAFIEKKTGHNVGYSVYSTCIIFQSWFDNKEFNLQLGTTDTLSKIQKQTHDYCKEFMK